MTTPYAPQRKRRQIDWPAMEAAAAADAEQIRHVEQQARESMEAFNRRHDPLEQLAQRIAALEERMTALTQMIEEMHNGN